MKIFIDNLLFFCDNKSIEGTITENFAEFKISTISVKSKRNALVIYGTFFDGERLIAQNFTKRK